MAKEPIRECPWGPNLFVVGAPKCGTTSLCRYLGFHPDIFVPALKEPLFFCTDQLHGERWRVADPERYLDLFAPGAGCRWRCEGSAWYLLSSAAPSRIRRNCRDPKIIIVLRNPVDMIVSLHAQFLFSANENIRNFERAYRAQARRARGRRIPWRSHFTEGLLYTRVGRYAPQVERYFEVFSRDRVKVLIFEDFFADVANGYRDVLDFLELDTSFVPTFTVENERHHIRSVLSQRLLVKTFRQWDLSWVLPPGRLRDGARRRLENLCARLKRINADGRPPPSLNAALRRRLHDDFADDIASLEALLDRDLSIWTHKNLASAQAASARADAGKPASAFQTGGGKVRGL